MPLLSASLSLCLHKLVFHMSLFQSNSMKPESDIKPTPVCALYCMLMCWTAEIVNLIAAYDFHSNTFIISFPFLLLSITLWHSYSFIIIFLMLTPLIFFEIWRFFFYDRKKKSSWIMSSFSSFPYLDLSFAHSPNICLMFLFAVTETKRSAVFMGIHVFISLLEKGPLFIGKIRRTHSWIC